MVGRRRGFWLAGVAVIVIGAVAFWLVLPRLLPEGGITIRILGGTGTPEPSSPVPRPVAVQGVASLPAAASTPSGPPAAPPTPRTDPPSPLPESEGTLRIPVAGVRPEELIDTYNQARSEGRTHNAIDILAPRGTPVLAAADGRVIELFQSAEGGTTLYQLDPDGRTVYYYAHLDGYAPGMAEGKMLRRGETLGYVGDTGNAGRGNFHLHFGVSIVDDPEQPWGGTDLNPYPLLRGEG